MKVEDSPQKLQGLMVLLASLSHGLEDVLGRGAKSVVFRAGQNVGLKVEVKQTTTDPLEAIAICEKELRAKGIAWQVSPWKPSSAAEFIYAKGDRLAVKVVCKNCMIRCSLFRYSHDQQQSLCMMNQGEFCGIFQRVTGKNANLEIIHVGENACLKELSFNR